MLTLSKCHITGPDMDDIEDAVIVVSGESPNATIRISVPDHEVRKFRTVDRLLNASIKGKGKNWTIEGESEQLATVVRTTDTLVKMNVKSLGGCQGCR
jgi:hypothetical protein